MADVEIRLGGRLFSLRPTFGAMREIEAKCNSSCATLLNMLARQEMHASEMAIVVYHGLVAAGESAGQERVGDMIFEAGVGSPEIQQSIAKYLAELLYAPDSAKKNAVGAWWSQVAETISAIFEPLPTPSDGDPETSMKPPPESSGESSKPRVKQTSK